jgi:hypothetical protein
MLTVEKTNRKDYNSNMTEYPMILKIISAEYIKDYKIKLVFSDKKERIINFEYFLEQARNPMTRKFLKINEFKNFKIEYGGPAKVAGFLPGAGKIILRR